MALESFRTGCCEDKAGALSAGMTNAPESILTSSDSRFMDVDSSDRMLHFDESKQIRLWAKEPTLQQRHATNPTTMQASGNTIRTGDSSNPEQIHGSNSASLPT